MVFFFGQVLGIPGTLEWQTSEFRLEGGGMESTTNLIILIILNGEDDWLVWKIFYPYDYQMDHKPP